MSIIQSTTEQRLCMKHSHRSVKSTYQLPAVQSWFSESRCSICPLIFRLAFSQSDVYYFSNKPSAVICFSVESVVCWHIVWLLLNVRSSKIHSHTWCYVTWCLIVSFTSAFWSVEIITEKYSSCSSRYIINIPFPLKRLTLFLHMSEQFWLSGLPKDTYQTNNPTMANSP